MIYSSQAEAPDMREQIRLDQNIIDPMRAHEMSRRILHIWVESRQRVQQIIFDTEPFEPVSFIDIETVVEISHEDDFTASVSE